MYSYIPKNIFSYIFLKATKILKSIKKGLNFKKSALEPLKIKIFRAKTISPTYLGINLGIYDQKVQIWTGPQKDKWT